MSAMSLKAPETTGFPLKEDAWAKEPQGKGLVHWGKLNRP